MTQHDKIMAKIKSAKLDRRHCCANDVIVVSLMAPNLFMSGPETKPKKSDENELVKWIKARARAREWTKTNHNKLLVVDVHR